MTSLVLGVAGLVGVVDIVEELAAGLLLLLCHGANFDILLAD